MKIFHTADWHLGKLVQGVHMTEDQAYVLDELIEAIKQEKPDVLIIAGDLYDRAIPPPEAIQLLDESLMKIVVDLKVPVLAIAGNHDSPNRLHFGSHMMKQSGYHIVGNLNKTIEKVTYEDEFGPVHFYLVPYADPAQVRNLYEDDTIQTFDDATRRIVDDIKQEMDPNDRHVFITHAFVTPYGEKEANTSESEKPLSIGGAEYVSSEHFKAFDYTALGHLHQAHKVGQETIRYSGSILKYSLSEEHHDKGYLVVDLDEAGHVTVEKKSLIPRRDIRTVRGKLDELLAGEKSDDYVFVELTDEHVVLQPMEKIRTVFPNAMQVKRVNDPVIRQITQDQEKRDVRTLSDLELFRAFYEEIYGKAVPDDLEELFIESLNKQLENEREGGLNK
ncbi:MAG TPA: exonuclease SbcCD subunit D [Pseudogracilibacillus sp.]|nr:exonuclease SbcCD subunit D [Pseudogracilibacillus sp.]